MLNVGDPVPSLFARSSGNPRYSLDSTAGRYVILSFIGGTRVPGMQAYVDRMLADGGIFDDVHASAFLISGDGADEAKRRIADRYPGVRALWDTDGSLARGFGCFEGRDGGFRVHCTTFILDAGLRVLAVLPIDDPSTHFDRVRDHVAGLPRFDADGSGWAPVLLVPNLLEPALCRDYIAYAEAQGLDDSGFMRTDAATGQTRMIVDHGHKRRSDCSILDPDLCAALQARIVLRLVPQIQRAFQFRATRIERYIVARYDAGTGGWFRPHKDNTTMGTAHRRFAVSINLNAEAYDGGDLRFPEYGNRVYRPPTGGAVVFSCSLLHEATPITRGSRYCVLPFLYDEAAAAVRLANVEHLSDPALRDNIRQHVVPGREAPRP